jgi:DtxR family Mn-dependent transcriptional regulator
MELEIDFDMAYNIHRGERFQMRVADRTLSNSLEDYLEAIHHIVRDKGAARGKDISARLGVNRSSVTAALRSLSERNLINYTPYDIITLTTEGERLAEGITQRHEVLKDFFSRVLGVDDKTAEENACGMEHAVSEIVLERLTKFIEFIRVCPRIDIRWIEDTGYFCRRPKSLKDCEQCIAQCLERLRQRSGKRGHTSN